MPVLVCGLLAHDQLLAMSSPSPLPALGGRCCLSADGRMVPSGDRWAFLRRDRLLLAKRRRVSRAGQGTLPSRGPKRRLVPAARLDELLSRAATVGVGVGHCAAQFFDGWCFRCGLFGSLAFPAVKVVFGGLAGSEE
jgi:hypothetical protein